MIFPGDDALRGSPGSCTGRRHRHRDAPRPKAGRGAQVRAFRPKASEREKTEIE